MDFEEPPPEDFEPSPASDLGPLTRRPPIQLALPVVAPYSLFCAFSTAYWLSPYRTLLAASKNTVFHDGEIWRLLTALFTHADVAHLLANTPLFLIFGWLLHAYF